MKNKIFFLVVLLLVSNLTLAVSQDRFPTKKTFTYCTTPNYTIDPSDTLNAFYNEDYILS